MAEFMYQAAFDKALSAHDYRRRWVPVILKGNHPTFPPNRIYKRLSRRAYETRAEAIAAAEAFMLRNGLRAWQRRREVS